jgi:hypothetical protein
MAMRLVGSPLEPIRRAAVLLIAKQLYLERNGVIPQLSKRLSRGLRNELIIAFTQNNVTSMLKELRELGYIKNN